MRLSGRNALVTGAAGGIGRAIVAKLKAEGGRVAAADKALEDIDADVLLPGDLADPEYCDSLPRRASEALGGLDIL